MHSRIVRYSCILALLLAGSAAQAQGTAFTYQGLLTDAGQPATGVYDLEFQLHSLHDAPAQLGATLQAPDVPVTNGLFTVTLDFGPGIFTGAPRWLQIGVRPGNSETEHSILVPRQPVNPSPYALFAGGVQATNISGIVPFASLPASANLWTNSNMNIYYNGGRVGIGTANPAQTLHVQAPNSGPQHIIQVGRATSAGGTNLVQFGDLEGGGLSYVYVGEIGVDDELRLRGNTAYMDASLTRVRGRLGINNGEQSPSHPLTVYGPNHQIAIKDSDNTNKTWTITSIQGSSGLGFYEDGSTATVAIESGGKLTTRGGKAVVYNYNASEKMIQVRSSGAWTVNNLASNSQLQGTLSWGNLGFTSPPAVFVGDFEAGASGLQGYHQFIITAHSVTTTGCTLRFFNAGSTSASLSGNINLLIIGDR